MTQTHAHIHALTLSLHMADKGTARSPSKIAGIPGDPFFNTSREPSTSVSNPADLIHGVLPAGALALLYAPSGREGTKLAWQLAHAVASQRDFHCRAVTQGSVLYVEYAAGEERQYENRSSLQGQVWAEHNVPPSSLLPLVEQAVANGCRLVILDSYASLAHRVSQDDAVDANHLDWLLLDPLADLAHESGATIIVLHHTSTHDDGQHHRGVADLTLTLRFDRQAGLMQLMPRDFQFVYEPVMWEPVGENGSRHADEMEGSLVDRRTAWLVRQLKAGPRTLTELLPGFQQAFYVGRTTLERLARKVLAEGVVTRGRLGRWQIYDLQ